MTYNRLWQFWSDLDDVTGAFSANVEQMMVSVQHFISVTAVSTLNYSRVSRK